MGGSFGYICREGFDAKKEKRGGLRRERLHLCLYRILVRQQFLQLSRESFRVVSVESFNHHDRSLIPVAGIVLFFAPRPPPDVKVVTVATSREQHVM